MSPLLTDVRRLTLYLAMWAAAGAVVALLWVTRVSSVPWLPALSGTVAAAVALGLLVTSAYFVVRAEPLAQGKGWRTGLRYALAALASGGVWVGLCVLGLQGLDLAALSDDALLALWAAGALAYLLSLLGHELWGALSSMRQAQARVAQTRLELREAQLQALRMQIQPHFLFNCLNSISALTSIDPAAARAMTLELAQFFRATLDLSEKERLALGDEVALCRHFLAIEQIRYGDKLRSTLQVSDAAARVLLPPMLIQPLVENAIKHGIRHLPQGGMLTLQASVGEGWLYVSVRNPVPAQTGAPGAAGGTGLRNIAARLQSHYGDRVRLDARQVGEEFVVDMALPVTDAGATA